MLLKLFRNDYKNLSREQYVYHLTKDILKNVSIHFKQYPNETYDYNKFDMWVDGEFIFVRLKWIERSVKND